MENLLHGAVCLYISVDSILSRREGPAQGGASWWREGGPFWSSQGGERVRAMGPGREGGGWGDRGEMTGGGGGELEEVGDVVVVVVIVVVVEVVVCLAPSWLIRFSKAWFFCSVST